MNEISHRSDQALPSAGDRLEELLRAAVDEQVSEQRQLTELLIEVRGVLGGVREADPAMADADADAEARQAQLLHRLEQTQAAVARIGEEMAGVHLAAARPESSVALQDVQDGLAGVRTDLRVFPEQIGAAVAHAVGAGLGDVGRLLTEMEQAQDLLVRDLGAVRAELADARSAGSAAALPAGTGERLVALETHVHALGAQQAALAVTAAASTGPDAAEIADIVREGVRDATRDFVRDYLRDAVQDIVTVSTRDTERRITEHMDEAVLALAQAFLRRRPALGAGPDVVDEAPSPAAAPPGPAAAPPGPAAAPPEPAAAPPAPVSTPAPASPAPTGGPRRVRLFRRR
ncbi:MAG TPA: hypothetical protein VGN54_07135 [Mycobacteriales bacterium]|nr:hypothetical protein [Mycobacteriales bacterium]